MCISTRPRLKLVVLARLRGLLREMLLLIGLLLQCNWLIKLEKQNFRGFAVNFGNVQEQFLHFWLFLVFVSQSWLYYAFSCV